MDEQPIQLLKETRVPVPATREHPRRVDYEYERAGTAQHFHVLRSTVGLATGDGAGASNEDRLGDGGWRELLRTRYASAEKVILVCDNLNTHTMGAFYEAFEPEKARAIVRRLEFRHTPKHGSWLNIAENELSSMTRQCVIGRRFATIDLLRAETAAWHRLQQCQNSAAWTGSSRSATRDAKLKSVYPKIIV